jgi:hypothetical protein
MAGFGLARLLFWRRRPAPSLPPAEPATEPAVDPRAEALRAKLDEARDVTPPPTEAPEAAAEAPVEVPDPEARRRQVHEAARAAVEEMRASGDERVDDEGA